MFAVIALHYMEELGTNKEDWDDPSLAKEARKLWDEIEAGIQSPGMKNMVLSVCTKCID